MAGTEHAASVVGERVMGIGYAKIRHFSGSRPTFTRYAGVVKVEGVIHQCGHSHGHKSSEAAVTCAGHLAKRFR